VREAAQGLRSNMKQSLLGDPIADPRFFEGCGRQREWRKMLYGLLFFHAVVQERRAFGPIGWNIPYEFNESDLRISVQQLHMYLDAYERVPFEALLYLTAQCNYGGRVTEQYDRRALATLLEDIYTPDALQDGYKLSPSGVYRIPSDGHNDYKGMLEVVQGLPGSCHPEVFGLHANADISKDSRAVQTLLGALLLTQTATGGAASGGEVQSVLKDLICDILAKLAAVLPSGSFDIEEVERRHPLRYEESMNTVLRQELIRYNGLLSTIQDSLQSLQAAVAGEVVMSASLDTMASQMGINQTPTLWMARSYPSLKPLANYVEDLAARLRSFEVWTREGAPNVFWLSGIFFPHALLTGCLQNYARFQQVPIDLVIFDFEMMPSSSPQDIAKSPVSGIYVHGLFLEGARWKFDERELGESMPKVLYEAAPIMWFKPCRKEDAITFPHYQCPVYRTSERRGTLATTGHSTNFVMAILVPSSLPPKHWIKRGTALLCSLNF